MTESSKQALGERRSARAPADGRDDREAAPSSAEGTSLVPIMESALAHLERFGLSGYRARVLAALIRLGPSGASQLARLAGIHRTAVYPVLSALEDLGLARPVPGQPGTWVAPEGEAVVDRLYAIREEELRSLAGHRDSTRRLLGRLAPRSIAGPRPTVQLLDSGAEARTAYDRLLGDTRRELLVLNRPPYIDPREGGGPAAELISRDEVNPVILRMLGEGVRIRVIYEASLWAEPGAEAFRQSMSEYHRAGVQGRLADCVPMKLAVADRRTALFAITGATPADGFPVNLMVTDEAYAGWQADAFEKHWATARPCD